MTPWEYRIVKIFLGNKTIPWEGWAPIAPGSGAHKWEKKTISRRDSIDYLNDLGAEGWEAVAMHEAARDLASVLLKRVKETG